MKKILLSVDCANDFASGVPGYFCRVLTQREIDRIQQLNGLVKAFNVDEISEFDFDGVWSSAEVDCDDEEVEMDFETADTSPSPVDVPRLVVCADYFYWQGLPDSLGENMRLTTNLVPMAYLTSDEKLFTQIQQD